MKMDFTTEQKEVFKKMGRKSADVRFNGMSKEEISAKMKAVRANRKDK